MSWNYFCLWKDFCELEKAEEKLFFLQHLQKYFELVFPHFYFKLAKVKVIFLLKKSVQKGRLPLIFQLEGNKEGKVGLCSLSMRVLCLSACA